MPVIILNSSADTVSGASVARRSHDQPVRVGLRIGDQLRDGPGRHVGMHLQHVLHADDPGHRRHVADEVETQLVVKRRIDRVCRRRHQQRVAVGGGAHDLLRRDVRGRPGPVFNDELLAQPFRQSLGDQPRGDVGRAAGRVADDEAHGSRGVASRLRHDRRCRQCKDRRRKREQSTTRQPAGSLLSQHRRVMAIHWPALTDIASPLSAPGVGLPSL